MKSTFSLVITIIVLFAIVGGTVGLLHLAKTSEISRVETPAD